MRVVTSADDPSPPAGAAVRVELRDVTELDAPSVLVTAADGAIEPSDAEGVVAHLTLDVHDPLPAGRDLVLWARVAGSDAARSSPGDWITVQSVPVTTGAAHVLDVPVRRIV